MAERTDAAFQVAVVGRGRVGSALEASLAAAGVEHRLLAGRGLDPAALAGAAAVVLAVPDAAIAPCAERIAAVSGGGAVLLHCAGARGIGELTAAREAGWAIGAMHPLASFPPPPLRVELRGVAFVIDGDPTAVRTAQQLARRVGAVPLTAPLHGPAYHALAALVANGAAALVNAAVPALAALGVERGAAEQALAALLRSVADNVRQAGVPRALTGPIMRGDAQTVAAHRAALQERAPAAAAAYRAVAPLILRCAVDDGLPPAAAQRIAEVLGD